MSTWSDDARADRLKVLWGQGKSASEVARIVSVEFGVAVTRNSVLSRVHRWGLPLRITGRKRSASTFLPASAQQPKAKPLPTTPAPEPSAEFAVSTLDLAPGQCKWPLNDGRPQWLHCGAQADDGPYCEFHARKSRGAGSLGERAAALTR